MASDPLDSVTRTAPSLAATLIAFFVGNLFANFVFLVGVVYLVTRALHLEALTVGLIGVYYAAVFLSDAHRKGGLRSWRPIFGPILGKMGEYFEFRMLSAGELEEGKQYVFACHPHGIHGFGTGLLMNDARADNPFYLKYPWLRGRVVGFVASVLFYVPLVREVFLMMNCRDADRKVVMQTLRDGNSAFIIVGGEHESLLSRPGTDETVAAGARRKGFVNVALEAGAQLVPYYMFHNTDTYYTSNWLHGFRMWISKRYRICFPIFWGRFFTPLPNNVQLTVAIGAPVPFPKGYTKPRDPAAKVPRDMVDAYHAAYLTALQDLFEGYKGMAGYPKDRKLIIHESN